MQLTHILNNYTKNIQYLIPGVKKIGYIGWLGKGNLGDEAMYIATKKAFGGACVLPYKYSKKIERVENILRKKIFVSVMLGGGTLINSEGCALLLEEAQKSDVLTFVFGSGVRDPDFWERFSNGCNLLKEWIPLLERCSCVGLRGPYSKTILEQAGFDKSEVIGDPALLLAQDKIKEKAHLKKMGFNIGITHQKLWGSEYQVLDFVVNFVSTMINCGWHVTFVPVWDKDLPYINEAVRRINKHVPIFDKYKSLPDTMQFLESCDIFIGEKLHSVILACCTYTPVIMLEYRPKCRDFMASMNLLKYNIRTDSLNFNKMIGLSNEVYERTSILQQHIYNEVANYKNKLTSFVANIVTST